MCALCMCALCWPHVQEAPRRFEHPRSFFLDRYLRSQVCHAAQSMHMWTNTRTPLLILSMCAALREKSQCNAASEPAQSGEAAPSDDAAPRRRLLVLSESQKKVTSM